MNKYSDLYNKYQLTRSTKTISLYNQLNSFAIETRNLKYSSSIFSISPDPPTFLTDRDIISNSPGISPISYLQNKNLREMSSIYDPENYQKRLRLPAIEIKSPSNKDFSELLAKIENVISPKKKPNINNINEDESFYLTQTHRSMQYFKVNTKGKRSPLAVKIKNHCGKIVIYLSFMHSYPGPNEYDRIFFNDFFEVSDNVFEFKSDHVYFSIFSENESSYKITIFFGRILTLAQMKKNKREIMLERIEYATKMFANRSKTKYYEKDFIRNNKDMTLQSSAIKIKDIQLKNELWEKKREEVNSKRKNFIIEKKIKAIESLNRRNRRLEKETRLKEELETNTKKRKAFEDCIKFLYFSKTICGIRNIIKEKREKIFYRLKINSKARIIQKAFRKKIKISDGKGHIVLASSCLVLYRNLTLGISKKICINNIFKFILTSAHANLLVHQIGNFGIKILKIQRGYKIYISKKKFRIKQLQMMWKKSIDKILFRKKGAKSKKKQGLKYISIPVTARNRILSEYYFETWKKFGETMKEYLNNKNKLECDGSESNRELKPPIFRYFPEESEMMEMIQKLSSSKFKK